LVQKNSWWRWASLVALVKTSKLHQEGCEVLSRGKKWLWIVPWGFWTRVWSDRFQPDLWRQSKNCRICSFTTSG
jgi:hypothetical protein